MSIARIVLTGVAGSALVCSLAACSSDATMGAGAQASERTSLAVVLGAHANGPGPQLVPGVKDLVVDAVEAGGDVSVVVSQGRPTVAQMPPFTHRAANDDAARNETRRNLASLADTLRGAKATTPENNLLAAIDTAARTMSSDPGKKVLVVVDNGLQTVAPLTFQDEGMLTAAPEDVANYLDQNDTLPKLPGVKVVLSGIGDTAAPQAPLTSSERTNLVAIWTTVLQRAGAEVEVQDEPLTAPALEGVPAVTEVPAGKERSFVADVNEAIESDVPTHVDLDDNSVAFVPDRATYRDAEAVENLLRPLAEQITAHGFIVSLVGTTATAGTASGRARLSKQRADAVRKTLVGLGVDPGSITAKGVGINWPGHVPDLDENGHLLPGPAARNRKVIVELKRGGGSAGRT